LLFGAKPGNAPVLNRGAQTVKHTSVNEQQIAEALQRVPRSRWREVLAFIVSLQAPAKGEIKMSPVTTAAPEKQWTAAELRKLPVQQRDAILAAQAALLEEEYRSNPELISFEAFGKDDLYVDSSNTEAR
jgi:hypothetical protein